MPHQPPRLDEIVDLCKDIIENVYNNINVDTKHGNMKINAGIYGDSVANYTPIYVKIDGKFEIIQIDELVRNMGK